MTCFFVCVFLVADLPIIMMPRAVAEVKAVGLEIEAIEEDASQQPTLLNYGRDESIYVSYVAMGEERTGVLSRAPGGLAKGDTLMVAYSKDDPYTVLAFRPEIYIMHITLAAMALAVYIVLWYFDSKI